MRLIAISVAAALCAVLAAGCASGKNEEIASTLKKKEIRVGIYADFKPLIFKDNNQLKGIEADLAAKVGEITGARIVYAEHPWSDLIPALEAGKIDVIMAGMTITAERAKKVAFTTSYLRVGQMALLRTSDINEFSTAEKVKSTNRRIGFIKNTTGDDFVRSHCPNAKKVPFEKPQDGIKSLSERRIDVFIIDAPVVWDLSTPDLTPLLEPLTEEHFGWAVRKNDTAMREALNKCLALMREDGFLETVKRKWVPQLLLK